jgi:arabinogalactan endo-1,4-beta-galactosidase
MTTTGPEVSRRHLLGATPLVALGFASLFAAPAAAEPTATARPASTAQHGRGRPLRMRGADISFTLQMEAIGTTYSVGSRTAPVERILRRFGANWVRLRVWTDPPAGYSTAASAIELARRAKRAGLNVLVDFHYSDFWADPGKQPTPAAWAGQSLSELARTVRTYTRRTLADFDRAGAPVDMVQVGNEVVAGMLWPLGQIYRDGQPDNWVGFTTLLKAGIAGVRDATHDSRRHIETMVHIDRGGDNGGSRWFFDHTLAEGVDFDVIGESYYPVWHGSLAQLQANLDDLAVRYGKDTVVVETAYPWTLADGDAEKNFITELGQIPDAERFPPTPAGQAAFYEALRQVLVRVPDGRGAGFFPWEPEWLPGVGWQPGAGNPNDNMTMFDWEGEALPALRALRPLAR